MFDIGTFDILTFDESGGAGPVGPAVIWLMNVE
jgi:hypothetical protein